MISTSLRIRFSAAFAASVIIASAVLSYAVGTRSSEQVRSEIGGNLAEVTRQVADKLDRDMWARASEVALLATLAEQRPDDPAAVQTALDRLKTSIPLFSWIGYTDAQGKVLAATDGILLGVDISARPVFAEGRKGAFIGDVHEAVMLARLLPNPSGEPMKFVDISLPVMGADGTLAGVMASHLSWEWAHEIEGSVLGSPDGRREVELFVVSADDTVLLGSAWNLGRKVNLRAVDTARRGGTGWRVETWADGRDYLTGYTAADGYQTFGGLGWVVLARSPVEAAFAPVAELQRHILLWGAGVALVFALVGWWVAGRVSGPLRRIAEAADCLREGRIAAIPVERGVTEIETLGHSLVALIDSLTRSETARDHAEKQASHDRLTGLVNRLGLEERLGGLIAASRRSGAALAVLCLDLDGFKGVNDTLGHHAGDLLLQGVAERLRACARQGDVLARLGGDEFLMVLAAPPDKAGADALMVGGRVIRALGEVFVLDGAEARIGCSIGAALWPAHGDDVKAVTRLADEALYAAKRGGKNRVVLHPLPGDGGQPEVT